MAKRSTRELGRFVREDRKHRKSSWRPSSEWFGSVTTQALAQALGTLLAAGIIVLGAAAVGQIQGLSTRAIVFISIAIVALAALLIAGASVWTSAAESYEGRKAQELLERSVEEMIAKQRERDEEIRRMEEERRGG